MIDTSFVYDPVAKLTRFHATNPAYEGVDSDHPSPFLDVLFVGAARTAVPEPVTWAMMIAGFAAIGFAMRQRRPETVAVPV
ncbi:PEPxxWA-CTERM sorting domain-containing protein [Sphingomonas bacterium]|uniref:PEPxxWA-CTERM sorting domain-containing protein n=1 Tax=Sphingomonas bacterium TaxID=1895847 RepID=UPI0020C61BAA|nr:PEPxxWA-CTERM sorting domain-containing protein [Sphingomonas bacterium]